LHFAFFSLVDNDSVAKDLEKRIRILCWIMTGPQNLDKKAIHVKKTWAKRCNTLIFISSTTNTSFPTIGLDVPEGREQDLLRQSHCLQEKKNAK
jgi:glycoprotein-N-acetylgalactosamine 3-beta-galactosyltransferase